MYTFIEGIKNSNIREIRILDADKILVLPSFGSFDLVAFSFFEIDSRIRCDYFSKKLVKC